MPSDSRKATTEGSTMFKYANYEVSIVGTNDNLRFVTVLALSVADAHAQVLDAFYNAEIVSTRQI